MLKLHKIDTCKDKIKNPKLSELNYIPKLTQSTLMIGKSGSGKSNTLACLLTFKHMLRGWFDAIYVISPTAKSDDVQLYIQTELKIPTENIFTDPVAGINHLENILNLNRIIIESFGADKAPKYAVILDDIIARKDVLKMPFMTDVFILARHWNLNPFLCAQSYTSVPRVLRIQASNIIIFANSASRDELEVLAESYTPPMMTKRNFFKMIATEVSEPYSFLYINNSVPADQRYRRNFEEIIDLDKYR